MVLENGLLTQLLIFVLAGIVLIAAGRWAIESSKRLAIYFGISEFAIGFILLAVATSLPELAVSISAGLMKQSEIIFGNVIGSNIADILLVLGISALIADIKVESKHLIDSAEILLFISLVPLILLGRGTIGLYGGLVLLVIFVIYSFFLIKTHTTVEIKNHTKALKKVFMFAVFGISVALLLFSANAFVGSAVKIAEILKVSNMLIGLTLVAVGTSMPELVVSIAAVLKKNYSLAIGNILGSCVVNLTLVLGTGAILHPIEINFLQMGSATIALVIVNILLWYVLMKHKKISKNFGLIFLGLYAAFLLAEVGILPLFAPNA